MWPYGEYLSFVVDVNVSASDPLATWASVAAAAATLGLLAAAVWAGRRVGTQIRLQRESIQELAETRETSLRLLILTMSHHVKPAAELFLLFRNIGPGPAQDVRVECWLLPAV